MATTTYNLSTPLKLVKYIQRLDTVPNFASNDKETVGTGDGSNATFWLNNIGVIQDNYTLYYGATAAASVALTETTHYALDMDLSKITLTAAGITLVSTANIYAEYYFNKDGILNSDLLKALNAAEDKVVKTSEQYFADSTADNPAYRKILNENIRGHYNPYDKVYDLFYNPLVCIDTTTNGAYTLGGTEIVLSDATGLPTTGTIYIDGNKVTYTGKSTNTLTIPATTPSIDDGSVVHGEVVEVSIEPEGSSPSYSVLDPHLDYEIDYMNGHVKILANGYWGEINASDRLYPANYLVRVSYMNAWRENGQDPEIPEEIEEIVNMIASKKLVQRGIKNRQIMGVDEFNVNALNSGDTDIKERLLYYKPLNVGSSQYNKQYLS